MDSIAWTIIRYLPFMLLLFAPLLLLNWANLPKENRAHQVIIPIVALVYGILAIWLFNYIGMALMNFFQWAGSHIQFIQNINWGLHIVFVSNVLIIVGFVIVKRIAVAMVGRIWGASDTLIRATAGTFYSYDESFSRWFLKSRYAQLRSYINGLRYGAVVAAAFLFILAREYPQVFLADSIFFPIVGLIVIFEIYYFLAGMTKSEYIEDILGEDERSYRRTNYAILGKEYRRLFPERILYGTTTDYSFGDISNFQMINELENSEDRNEQLLGSYFALLKSQGEIVDVNYAQSCKELFEGNSVIFYNPFYRDFSNYLYLPIMRALMSYKKCLVVVGRESAVDDVSLWLDQMVVDSVGAPGLWKVGRLKADDIAGGKDDDIDGALDIGILSLSDIYNQKIQEDNKTFFDEIEFVLLVEPSKLLTTGQLGLSLIADKLAQRKEQHNDKIVYCIFDRNCDGLVDALSHTLQVELCEVTASLLPTGSSSQYYWKVDGPYIHHKLFSGVTHYMGMGTEVASVALKHQVARTVWLGGSKFPVLDMRWIMGQYYRTLCRFIGLPVSQEKLSYGLQMDENIWGVERSENLFAVVEDEFRNPFELIRLFASRAENQSFINLLCENYLVRDYMTGNADTFQIDPKAIPSIVADFARTERNCILRLVMRMSNGDISEEEVVHDFKMCGIEAEDVFIALQELADMHCGAGKVLVHRIERAEFVGDSLESEVRAYYGIDRTLYAEKVANRLESAYYVIEDELEAKSYIGSRLRGHVYQELLPGQFITYEGKYYEVTNINEDCSVVVRRAADHLSRRRYYKQLRKYKLSNWAPGKSAGATKQVSSIRYTQGTATVDVSTLGHLEMSEYGDFKSAREVLIEGIPKRRYDNKTVIRIGLDGTSKESKFALCFLLNELFRTTYSDGYAFVCALTAHDGSADSPWGNMLYSLEAPGKKDDAIYIIEDSEIDLGLAVSVLRNFDRFMEIICEYIDWSKSDSVDVDSACEKALSEDADDEPADSKDGADEAKDAGDESSKEEDATSPEPEHDISACEELKAEDLQEKIPTAFSRLFDDYEDQFTELSKYLNALGYLNNPLYSARINSDIARAIEEEYDPNKEGANYCDFCGVELLGGEYDVLADGRQRCNYCGLTAVKTEEEFKKHFRNALRNMETYFDVKFKVPLKVRMTDAKTVAKEVGREFTPTSGFTSRVLGFARRETNGTHTIYIENGAPALQAIDTIVHELTHIWQFINWDDKKLEEAYKGDELKEIYEGMAMWASIQYMVYMNEIPYAKRSEMSTRQRDDYYGRGFNRFAAKYPIIYARGAQSPRTPFEEFPPIGKMKRDTKSNEGKKSLTDRLTGLIRRLLGEKSD